MTKPCQKCGEDFNPAKPWQVYCGPLCRNNSHGKREGTRLYQQARRDKIDAIKLEAGCAKCGYREHPAALDFNHISGEKLFNVSHDPKKAWDSILAEIAKCEVLCANCHRVHTHQERHWITKRKDSQ